MNKQFLYTNVFTPVEWQTFCQFAFVGQNSQLVFECLVFPDVIDDVGFKRILDFFELYTIIDAERKEYLINTFCPEPKNP